MPSTITFSSTTTASAQHSIYRKPAKKPMSLTSVYFLAHSARGKLSKEASRADHNLRLLVGHANMLDSLMLDLAHAEQEQEAWFNKTTSRTSVPEEHEQIESIEEETEEEDSMDEDYDSDEETKPEGLVTEIELDSQEEDEDHYPLTRTTSRHSPPELSSDSDESEDEDEHMPPSPPSTIATFTEKQRQAIATTSFYDTKDLSPTEQLEQEGYYLPSRQQPAIVAAY